MAPSKKNVPAIVPPMPAKTGVAPSKASRSFSTKKSGDLPITHERIAADLEEFEKAGGKIEVLGITRVPSPSEPKPKPVKPRR